MKRNSMKKRFLCLLLCTVLICGLIPISVAFAAGEGKAMSGGATALSANVNTANAQVVYYGGRPYYVIGYGTSGVQTTASTGTTATLLAKNNFEQSQFNSVMDNGYGASILRTKVEGIAAALSEQERASILSRTLEVGTYSPDGSCDGVAGSAVENAYLWPLSSKEANAVDQQLRIADPDHPTWATSYWWLRSPHNTGRTIAVVNGQGGVSIANGGNYDREFGVRPAFNLNLNSVLFTSAAVGGKPNGLQAINDYSGNEWKLTLKDSSRDKFMITNVQHIGDAITVSYGGANVGSNEYISVLVTDSTVAYTHYGKLTQVGAFAGMVTFTLPELAPGSKVYIFNEQCNGDYMTDYASELVELAIPEDGSGTQDGRQVELRSTDTHIQWKYTDEGEEAWRDLASLADLSGSDGQNGADGQDGREVELQVAGGYIQWRYTGGTWTNLIALSLLKGADGADGEDGQDGVTPQLRINADTNMWEVSYDNGATWTSLGVKATGSDGKDGADGLTPYIGSNGNWWIGSTDTGIKAAGVNGTDGKDGADGLTPYIGNNGNWWIGSTDTGIKAAGANGTNGKDGADGQDGANGVGIADIQINENGELIVILTDGTEKNLGKVTGNDGVGITNATINENGELILTLSDGTELNAGIVRTEEAMQAMATVNEQNSGQTLLLYIFMGISGVAFAGMIGMLIYLLKKHKSLVGK